MNTQMQSQDRLAKLLATENIDIVRSNVRTASFDLRNRTLLLPRWKEMTPEVEEMLMLHEVGHALFTTTEDYEVVFKEKKVLKEYANVLEDVRIEKKMKDRYPGSRKSFNTGYRQLNERDFFGVKEQDLSKLLLIDRINLYFKVGFNCGVKFTAEEYQFIRKADLCESVDDVIALAEEIYEFSKQDQSSQLEDITERIKQEQTDEDSEYDEYDDFGGAGENEDEEGNDGSTDNDSSDSDDEGDENGQKPVRPAPIRDISKISDEDVAPKTMKAFEQKLDLLADDKLMIQYYQPEFENEYNINNIVDYRTVLSQLTRYNADDEYNDFYKRKYLKFKSATSPMVGYLVKEFEMKKSASSYKRAKISKLGSLDTRKLYAYKLKDDMFRQIMRVDEGKKHGMIFLLDWSGSMANCIEETLEQVINLAMFCQRIQIPYQVFAFSDGYQLNVPKGYPKKNNKGFDNNLSFALLELFSHKMTSVEFNKMISLLINKPWSRPNYGLNGTPLNEALLYMTKYVGKFIKDNQVEKMSFITLSDGDGGALYAENRIINGSTYDSITAKKINKKCILKDPMTKKDYDLSADSSEQTALLLNVIRDRWNTRNIGFFLIGSSYRHALSFIDNNMANINTPSQRTIMSESIVDSMRKKKYCVLENVPGRNEFYLLPNNIKIDQDASVDVDDTMNSGQIARQLTKAFNNKKTSRVVLSKFIEQVS